MDDDIDGMPLKNDQSPIAAGFIPSKWETVDPEQIEAQAITTSKWETLDTVKESQPHGNISEDSFDSFDYNEEARDVDEEKRIRLREVELKTVQYQDELESGQRNLKSGWTVQQQAEHYRRKLMKKSIRDLQQDSPMSGRTSSLKRSPNPSPTDSLKRLKKSKRSPSPQYNRNPTRRKSRSPGYSKKSNRDSVSPSKYRTKRDRNRSESRSRSSSLSPKRYKDRSESPSSRSSKHDSSRRYNR